MVCFWNPLPYYLHTTSTNGAKKKKKQTIKFVREKFLSVKFKPKSPKVFRYKEFSLFMLIRKCARCHCVRFSSSSVSDVDSVFIELNGIWIEHFVNENYFTVITKETKRQWRQREQKRRTRRKVFLGKRIQYRSHLFSLHFFLCMWISFLGTS